MENYLLGHLLTAESPMALRCIKSPNDIKELQKNIDALFC